MNEEHSLAANSEGPPPPPMCDAWLNDAKLAELFDDLAGLTEIVGIQVKAGPQVQVSDSQTSLTSARELLNTGQVRGVQIRYRYQGHEWCDTIMRINERYRLIRCQYM